MINATEMLTKLAENHYGDYTTKDKMVAYVLEHFNALYARACNAGYYAEADRLMFMLSIAFDATAEGEE